MCAYVPLKVSTRGSRNRGVRPTFHEEQFLTSTDKYMAPDERDKTTYSLYSEALPINIDDFRVRTSKMKVKEQTNKNYRYNTAFTRETYTHHATNGPSDLLDVAPAKEAWSSGKDVIILR